MNRRELLLGLTTSLIAAKISIPTELAVYGRSPAMASKELLEFLERVHQDLINKLCNPPYILYANGSMEQLSMKHDLQALQVVNLTLKELYKEQA